MELNLLQKGSQIGVTKTMWDSPLFSLENLLKTAILNVLTEAFEKKF